MAAILYVPDPYKDMTIGTEQRNQSGALLCVSVLLVHTVKRQQI